MSKKLTPLAKSLLEKLEKAIEQERGGHRLVTNTPPPRIEPLIAPNSIPPAPPPGPLTLPRMEFPAPTPKTTGKG